MGDRGRVLQILGPSTGGIRRHVSYLTGQLCTLGWEVAVAGPDGVLDGLDHVVPMPAGIDPVGAVRAWRAVRAIVDQFDVVHAHGLKAGWIASLAGGRAPLVVSIHNLVLDDVAGRAAPLLRQMEARMPGRAAATIAISREVAARFAGVSGAERIVVVAPAGPPPVPDRDPASVRADLGIAPTDDLVVTAARLHPQKGLDLLLDAADLVRRSRPGLRWFVFGEGPLRTRLEAAIVDRGLVDVVHLAGSRHTVDNELAAADVVASTSVWESGPLVVLEALALGRPVVSTRVGLAGDVIGPGDGRLVEVGDVDGFASAVIAMLENPLPTARGVSGSSARLSPSALAAEVEMVYREVLSR